MTQLIEIDMISFLILPVYVTWQDKLESLFVLIRYPKLITFSINNKTSLRNLILCGFKTLKYHCGNKDSIIINPFLIRVTVSILIDI